MNPRTHKDVRYGPHACNVLDVYRSTSNDLAPVAVFIHGGGWKGGDKEPGLVKDQPLAAAEKLMAAGVAIVSINYRFTSAQDPPPAPALDAARAIQFVRCHAASWGMDRARVAAFGGSAGGCSALWLAFHDDLANPASEDPVERESTRLCCVAGINAQSSIYPDQLREWVGPAALEHGMVANAFGLGSVAASYDAGFENVYRESSPFTHLDETACPVYMKYTIEDLTVPAKDQGHGIHHPLHGVKLKEAMDALGLECRLDIGADRDGDGERYGDYAEFLLDKLNA